MLKKSGAIISMKDVGFRYDSEEDRDDSPAALENINLEIQESSFTAILGRNGSGKSTLSKMMNALLVPQEGAVFVFGMNTRDDDLVWEIRSSAGMVFQNPDNQLISAIVEDDVAFGLENTGVPAPQIRERIDDAMKKTGIYDLRKKSPHMLSGGQKQRVAIAGVVAMKPRCVIFDEPTAMLDPKGRKEVINIIGKLRAEGVTIVLITHFMEEAVLADQIVIMENGKIVKRGTPAEIFADTEEIRRIGLDVPPAVKLREDLAARGISIPAGLVTEDKLAAYLCGLIKEA